MSRAHGSAARSVFLWISRIFCIVLPEILFIKFKMGRTRPTSALKEASMACTPEVLKNVPLFALLDDEENRERRVLRFRFDAGADTAPNERHCARRNGLPRSLPR